MKNLNAFQFMKDIYMELSLSIVLWVMVLATLPFKNMIVNSNYLISDYHRSLP